MGINAEEHSFLISSDSLESVKSRMIGFMICAFRKEKTDFFKRKLASKEDFDVLDSWYFKWTRFYRALAENRYPLLADLSGGLDTRIILFVLIICYKGR